MCGGRGVPHCESAATEHYAASANFHLTMTSTGDYQNSRNYPPVMRTSSSAQSTRLWYAAAQQLINGPSPRKTVESRDCLRRVPVLKNQARLSGRHAYTL